MRISDWSSDVCSSDLVSLGRVFAPVPSEFLLIASTALLLTGFGLIMVLSATSALDGARNPFEHVIKQGVFAVLGIPLMFIASRLPVAFWRRMAWPVLIGDRKSTRLNSSN